MQLIQIYHDARQYQDAVSTFEQLHTTETTLTRLYQAASHAALGHAKEAKENIERVLQLGPEATLEKWTSGKMAPYKNPKELQHFRDNLRKAGFNDRK